MSSHAPTPSTADELGGPAARLQAFWQERTLTDDAIEPSREFLENMPADERALEGLPRAMADAPPSPVLARLRALERYRQRQGEQLDAAPADGAATRGGLEAMPAADAPFDAAVNRWSPIGPVYIQNGQAGTRPAVSGRTPGIAVAPGGYRLYAATANGGVWRSENEGRTWQSLMDAFDLNPTAHRSDSLACGAIALAAGDWSGQDIIYVGTGEGFNTGENYFGVGPVVSSDGGLNWDREASDPPLEGGGFYALAVDPVRVRRVVAATNRGLYLREPDGAGGFIWRIKEWGQFTSVVAAYRGGRTSFFAARRGGPIYFSNDGASWASMDQGFPTDDVSRISLAVQPHNPNVLYALVSRSNGNLRGLFRFDADGQGWREVLNAPSDLLNGQGWYDLAIAVAPHNVNQVYLGGQSIKSDGVQPHVSDGSWSAALFRLDITQDAQGQYVAANTYLGGAVHSDVHALVFAPGSSNKLWAGCDGGVFYCQNPTLNPNELAAGETYFAPRNTGLSTLTMKYLGQHPQSDAVLFCGTQDNGGLRYTGEQAWVLSSLGDCGCVLVNWLNPYHVLFGYTYSQINVSFDGGNTVQLGGANVIGVDNNETFFYPPLAGVPYTPDRADAANRAAFGSSRVWISDTFGADWRSIPTGIKEQDRLNGRIRALTFATPDRLYAGTEHGGVYRFDRQVDNNWVRTPLLPLPQTGIITGIAVDPADDNAIYVTLGGAIFSNRRVWRFSGGEWQDKSGPAGASMAELEQALLDTQHNTIVIDPENPGHLYVGADIGVWRSTDGGATWHTFARGLPDAAVLDLKIHADGFLRAATHGRSVYELMLRKAQKPVELYVRHHQLDRGDPTMVAPDWAAHPTRVGEFIQAGDSPDIRFDILDAAGQYRLPDQMQVDYHDFLAKLPDAPAPAQVWNHAVENVMNRVYVQVHNRGTQRSSYLHVVLLLANLRDGVPALPADFGERIQNGQPVETEQWHTVGLFDLHGVQNDRPQIAAFDLSAFALPHPDAVSADDQYALIALVHSFEDPFELDANGALNLNDRKVAHKYIRATPYVTEEPPEPPTNILATYLIRPGDTLWAIAQHFYGNGRLWPHIYQHNRALIGPNPNGLPKNVAIEIPVV